MKDLCIINQRKIQLFKGNAGIRPGFSRKSKIPVSVGIKGYKGKGGKDVVGSNETASFDTGLL